MLRYLINVIAISFPSFEKSSMIFAGSKHWSYLSSDFVFAKFHWICLLIFLHYCHDFHAKLRKCQLLGPIKISMKRISVLQFLWSKKFSASYFKMPGLWTLYSINLLSHRPPWRRVDQTVTVFASVTSPFDLSGYTKIGHPVVLRTINGGLYCYSSRYCISKVLNWIGLD